MTGKKILISSCAGLGDLIMFTPALRTLKQTYPDCQITFMTNDKYVDILSGLPYLDKVICIKRKKFLGRLRVLKDLIKQDYLIFTDWQPQLLFAGWLFGVKNRMGIPKLGHSLNKKMTKQLTVKVLDYTQYAAKTNAMLFEEALDIDLMPDAWQCDVGQPKKENVARVDALLNEIGLNQDTAFVLLTPFAGLEQRNWPKEEAEKLVSLVKTQYGLPVLVLGPGEKRDESAGISPYNLVGRTDVLDMVEFIRRAKLLITPDSGPMHIAGALGTKVVALFSKDLPSRWAPRKLCQAITLNMKCSPCNDETAQKCKTVACMRNITAEMVMEAIAKLSL